MKNIGDTQEFSLNHAMDEKTKKILKEVYAALQERGYDADMQLMGYFVSDDPTYITEHANARNKMTKIERYETLTKIIHEYFRTIE